ncbi:ionotropic receptor 25a-like isoform X2 [Portunus trituberculatus]|uniref:ionotropic receptor 25a-like isoform X2 n=1 Tax=Portunus trituberculatus TaxID=210409 RepID=UPI001E1CFE58|nr:ionotropic receptor 25a-like isoform X2 [Portunus trituberculatus]
MRNVDRGSCPYWWNLVMLMMFLAQRTTAQLTLISTIDESMVEAVAWLEEAVKEAETSSGLTIKQEVIMTSLDKEEENEQQFCSALFSGAALVLDVTAGGWTFAQDTAAAHGIPYVRVQVSNYQWLAATDHLLQSRNATDAALIFGSEAELDQALYYLVEGSVVRVIVLPGIDDKTTTTLRKMRPAPSYYVILAATDRLTALFNQAIRRNLVTRDSRWTLVAMDHGAENFDRTTLAGSTGVTLVNPTREVCCAARNTQSFCDCDNLVVPKAITLNAVLMLVRTLKAEDQQNIAGTCDAPPDTPPSTTSFYTGLQTELGSWPGMKWRFDKMQMEPQLAFNIQAINSTASQMVGSWSTDEGLQLIPGFEHSPIRRHFRLGTILSRPWVSLKKGAAESEAMLSTDPNDYVGYCVDLAERLAKEMKFDYDFRFPKDGQYGVRQKDGTWNGLVGDLSNGVTDIIVAPLTMTSEREEVIDFVAPYFDQSGISIVIRKRQREESLFKFMTVLRAEVWVSIVAALVVTGIMIWLLDRYSPYSAQNNSTLYPPNCRKFTLKESFWFALTSFTPQGGGEAPKALSGRTLVAAYWLFVVLMLATFTANLAAFLTVERMQSPVQSLEALARQAKINFTTVKGSSTFEYFDNMAKAEDELFRVWKELTLNSTSDQSKYRVWDYPIKEQYTHILQVIVDSKPVLHAEEGFQRVRNNEKGEFAFIHDASEIRYEVLQDCQLTEVGEPFAEQPYAIAVQQGSHLQDEISRAILELQKDRYFEALTAKFWNRTERGACPDDSDSEGITLQSLGGVFIATLIGLALAMVALAVEVLYYKRGKGSHVSDITPRKSLKMVPNKSHVSRINVTPVY